LPQVTRTEVPTLLAQGDIIVMPRFVKAGGGVNTLTVEVNEEVMSG